MHNLNIFRQYIDRHLRADRIADRILRQPLEAARLDALASECGSKKEPLIRRLIMGVEIKPRPTEGQLRLVREISGIANNINQITRLANTVKSVSPAQVEELQRLCSEALSLLKESL